MLIDPKLVQEKQIVFKSRTNNSQRSPLPDWKLKQDFYYLHDNPDLALALERVESAGQTINCLGQLCGGSWAASQPVGEQGEEKRSYIGLLQWQNYNNLRIVIYKTDTSQNENSVMVTRYPTVILGYV